jgi:autotransporter translocation and assembly factor TamB
MNTARVRRGIRLPRSATVQLAAAVAGLATGGVCRLLTLAGPENVLWAAMNVASALGHHGLMALASALTLDDHGFKPTRGDLT